MIKLALLMENKWKVLEDAQRAEPENAMLEIAHSQICQIYSYVAEHVGDLTNRMAQVYKLPGWSEGAVEEKVDKTLHLLKSSYGFEREMADQVKSNVNFNIQRKNGSFPKTVEEATEKLRKLGKKYADAHRKLPVFNTIQHYARDAAVAVGEMDFRQATRKLEMIQSLMKTHDWKQLAMEEN